MKEKSKAHQLITFTTLVLGVGLFIWLALQQDGQKLYDAFLTVGWNTFLVVLTHALLPMVITSQAWRVLQTPAPSFLLFYRARWIREAAKNLLPLMQLGGDAVGARVLILGGIKPSQATIITIADITTEATALIPFAIIGILLALDIAEDMSDPHILHSAIIGGIILVIATLVFLVTQKLGIFRVVERFLFAKFETSINLHDALMTLYKDAEKSLVSSLWHCVAWLAGSFEIWLIFYFIGHPISLPEAILIESLGQAIKSATFFIPAAIGIQEGSFILIGSAIGIPTEIALAGSLIRRVRHIMIGVPALIYWSRIESKRRS